MRVFALVSAIALAACATSRAPSTGSPQSSAAAASGNKPAAASDSAAAIKKAMQRELPPLEQKPFRTPGGIEGKVEAAAAPETKAGEGLEELTVSLGTEGALTCSLFAKRIDIASTTWRIADSVKKGLKLLVAHPLNVIAIGGSPLLLAELGYQAEGQKGPMIGQLKIAVYAHDAHSFLCMHDEPGYTKTFERVVKGLAASLKGGADDERASARFAEVTVMRLGEMVVGYNEHVVWNRKRGGRVAVSYSAQLMPRGPTDLLAADAYSEEETDAQDLLAAGNYAHVTNGEADTHIRLTREKDGKTFRYEGQKDGKPLQGTFVTKAGLSTDLWFARRFAASAPAPKGDIRHEAYSYEANPVSALPIVYRVDPSKPRRAVMELGSLRIDGELDPNGLLAGGEIPVGPTKLVFERTWSRGSP